MLKRDWGVYVAIGLIAGGSLTLLFLVGIVGLNYCPGSPCEYYNSSDQNPNKHSQENLRWLPFAFGPNTTNQLGPDDQEGSEQYYTRQDLRAQESVARATNAIVTLTAISIVIGAVGVASVVVTIYLNIKAVTTANEANLLTRMDQRPWIKFTCTPTGRFWFRDDKLDIGVDVILENIGKSPAFVYLPIVTFVDPTTQHALSSRPFIEAIRADHAHFMGGHLPPMPIFPGEKVHWPSGVGGGARAKGSNAIRIDGKFLVGVFVTVFYGRKAKDTTLLTHQLYQVTLNGNQTISDGTDVDADAVVLTPVAVAMIIE